MGEKKKRSVVGTALSLPGKIWKLIKLIIFFVVIGALIIGYSGYKTIQGFRDESVQQSEFLYVDTVNNTANFTLTIENEGFLPISVEIDFKLDLGIRLGTGDRVIEVYYTTTEKFDVKGGDSQTKNIVFKNLTDEDIAKVEDGATVKYISTVRATYSWFIPIKETELDKQEIVILKQNFKPEIQDIEIAPEPVLTGAVTHITTDVTDRENDTLWYNYTMNGNLLNVSSDASEFDWVAPDVPGENILEVEVSDSKNTVKETVTIQVQKPLFLTINSTVRHDDGEVDVWVNSSKSLGADVPEVFYKKEGGARTSLAVALVGGNNDSFKGTFDFSDGTYFINATATDPVNTAIVAKEHSELRIESISTVAKKAQVTTTNVTIDITTEEDLTDVSFSIEEVTENVVNETTVDGEQLYSLKKFIKIETEDVLKDNLSWALVRIDYDEGDLPARADENNIALYFWNEENGEWEKVDIVEIDTVNNYFIANITHFSIYGGFSSNRAPFVNAGNDLVVVAGESAELDAYIVDDLDDEMMNISWDFDGDGVYDYSSNSTVKTTHIFDKEGTYNVTVRITDKGGAHGYDTIFVTVEKEKDTGLKGALAEMPAFELPSVITAWVMLALIVLYKRKKAV